MNNDDKNHLIALFIDNENLRQSLKNDKNIDYSSKHVCKYLSDNFGTIVLGKSYWAHGRPNDPRGLPGGKNYELSLLGIKIVPIPTYIGVDGIEKNNADGEIIIDIMYALERYPAIDLWVLVSNDKDFIPILEELRRRGKQVILIHSQDVRVLNVMCDRLGIIRILYQDIVSHGAR